MPLAIKLGFILAVIYAVSFGLGVFVGLDVYVASSRLSNLVGSVAIFAWILSIIVSTIGIFIALGYGIVMLAGV
jgi:hypothetical protein